MALKQNQLNKFRYKIHKSHSDKCRLCGKEVETTAHLFIIYRC